MIMVNVSVQEKDVDQYRANIPNQEVELCYDGEQSFYDQQCAFAWICNSITDLTDLSCVGEVSLTVGNGKVIFEGTLYCLDLENRNNLYRALFYIKERATDFVNLYSNASFIFKRRLCMGLQHTPLTEAAYP